MGAYVPFMGGPFDNVEKYSLLFTLFIHFFFGYQLKLNPLFWARLAFPQNNNFEHRDYMDHTNSVGVI